MIKLLCNVSLSPDQIRELIDAAAQSGYRTLRRDTYHTLFALLACTGLRVSEAIRLQFQDLTPDGLVIRKTKFCKSRFVPLHPTAQAGLERYLQQRYPYAPAEDHVFVSLRRKPLLLTDVSAAFQTAARAIGLPDRPKRLRPTPHSLRHTFAVRALQTCPDGRDDITQHMVALSTYLGHGRVAHLLVSGSGPRVDEGYLREMRAFCSRRATMTTPMAPHLTAFFQQRLPIELGRAPNQPPPGFLLRLPPT